MSSMSSYHANHHMWRWCSTSYHMVLYVYFQFTVLSLYKWLTLAGKSRLVAGWILRLAVSSCTLVKTASNSLVVARLGVLCARTMAHGTPGFNPAHVSEGIWKSLWNRLHFETCFICVLPQWKSTYINHRCLLYDRTYIVTYPRKSPVPVGYSSAL